MANYESKFEREEKDLENIEEKTGDNRYKSVFEEEEVEDNDYLQYDGAENKLSGNPGNIPIKDEFAQNNPEYSNTIDKVQWRNGFQDGYNAAWDEMEKLASEETEDNFSPTDKKMEKPEYSDELSDKMGKRYKSHFESNESESEKEELEEEKGGNESSAKSAIKELIKTNWGGNNKDQGKAAEMIKGLSFNDSDVANKFMDDLNKLTDKMDLSKYGIE